MTQQPLTPVSEKATISKEFLEKFAEESGIGDFILEGTIKPGELHDILTCVAKLKSETGWGRIELHYKNSDLDEHITAIKGKVEH